MSSKTSGACEHAECDPQGRTKPAEDLFFRAMKVKVWLKNRACRRAEEMERSGSSEAVEGDNVRVVGMKLPAGAEGSRNKRKSPKGFGAFHINV